MKDKALDFLKKNRIIISLFLILIIGSFFRAYHFSDWLHFELDQSRDAKVIDLALNEGVSNLPLLGPKAAGSFLRLGPIFYYFEYLSAKIFGSTPPGMIVLSLLFSCLTIIVVYYFLKRYFDSPPHQLVNTQDDLKNQANWCGGAKISLLLTLLFSVSIFFIMYSRFGWNPNDLPFFTLLCFLALLKFCDPEEKRRGLWMIIFAFAISAATQLHFLAFVALPALSTVFLIIKRPRVKLAYWVISIFIILLFYFPPILNDLKTGGDNIKEFQKVFAKKSTKDEHTPLEKIYRNCAENSLGYFLILSGYEKSGLPKLDQHSAINFEFICDQACKDKLPAGIIAFILMTSGGALLLFKNYQELKKQESPKKDFLILNLTWFIIAFGLFYPISFDISPRFFLLIAGLPFVFLGLIFEFIKNNIKKARLSWRIILLILLVLSASNIIAIKKRFWQMANAPFQSFEIGPDKILKEKNRVTLKQQLFITDYEESKYKENKFPVYLNSDPYYRRSFLYHLEKREIPRDDFRNVKTIYERGNYFLIYPSASNLKAKMEKYLNSFNISETKIFGTLTVFYLTPKPEAISAIEQEFEPKGKPKSAPGVPVRYRWEEIFNTAGEDEKEIDNL